MAKANQNIKTKGKNSKASAQKSNSSMGKKDVRQEVTDRIIEIMERGTEAWRKTWSVAAAHGMPINGATGVAYRGVNVLTLWLAAQEQGFGSCRWMTFKQASMCGGQVRRGERGTQIVFYQMKERAEENDRGEEEVRRFPMLKTFTVFNVTQIDGLPEHLADQVHDLSPDPFSPDELAEQTIQATGASISHGGDRAAYSPNLDQIVMPVPEAFETPENYYSTCLHELAHWTGHPSRLSRDLSGRFGDEAYAMEELIAELGAAFCAGSLGFIDATVEGHASYLDSWIRVLKSDKTAIFTAAAQAQAAHDFIMSDTLAEE